MPELNPGPGTKTGAPYLQKSGPSDACVREIQAKRTHCLLGIFGAWLASSSIHLPDLNDHKRAPIRSQLSRSSIA
jgi:hypothetical protein